MINVKAALVTACASILVGLLNLIITTLIFKRQKSADFEKKLVDLLQDRSLLLRQAKTFLINKKINIADINQNNHDLIHSRHIDNFISTASELQEFSYLFPKEMIEKLVLTQSECSEKILLAKSGNIISEIDARRIVKDMKETIGSISLYIDASLREIEKQISTVIEKHI